VNAPTPIDIGKRIDQYIRLRDRISEIKKKHEAELEPYKVALEQLNTMLLNHLNTIGTDSASATGVGTVYRTEKKSASIGDQGEFRRYVIGGELWDLCDWRANTPAVEEFIKTHHTPPPGVNFSSTFVVGVRRASK
jgi:hypothetical protein